MKKTITVRRRLAQGFAISGVIALASGWALQPIEAQIQQLLRRTQPARLKASRRPGNGS